MKDLQSLDEKRRSLYYLLLVTAVAPLTLMTVIRPLYLIPSIQLGAFAAITWLRWRWLDGSPWVLVTALVAWVGALLTCWATWP
ncbi:hypothetical protein PVT67_01360 [Gallaecimonas kandeliae]|uniref:hypothetical protein n=1 Tax=Gallaecimonas kandeliae TaxID=3029055 RepID=UPI0026490FA7|nr:hypothetical protein [Gallaecimonas kandeliae]WKE65937.1 hypothetical protein PVT67_01360 [Gallaecimonas kandeliae]